jgi:predicted MFS family arabinose efflux permease
MGVHSIGPFVGGALVAFALGWGWPGLFNLAVVDSHRETPGAASGVSQTGIYVGAAGGPAAFGALYTEVGYSAAWLAVAGLTLLAAAVMWLAARADRRIRAVSGV